MHSVAATEVSRIIAESRSLWDADCRDVETRLSDMRLGFGINGYRIAMERGLHRINGGVATALALIRDWSVSGTAEWIEAHAVLHEAIDVEFYRASQLIAALEYDPLLTQMLGEAHQRISAHEADAASRWWRAPLRWIGRLYLLARRGLLGPS